MTQCSDIIEPNSGHGKNFVGMGLQLYTFAHSFHDYKVTSLIQRHLLLESSGVFCEPCSSNYINAEKNECIS